MAGVIDDTLAKPISMSKLYETLDEALHEVKLLTLCLGTTKASHDNVEILRGMAIYSSPVTEGTLLVHGAKLSIDDDLTTNELITWRALFNMGFVQQAVLLTEYEDGAVFVEANI